MEDKAKFVEEYLKPLIIAARVGVSDVRYGKSYGKEIVVIENIGGFPKEINVAGDSLIALTLDVIKNL